MRSRVGSVALLHVWMQSLHGARGCGLQPCPCLPGPRTYSHSRHPPPPPAALLPAARLARPPAALSNQESLKERKLGALHQALAMYQQRLGLEFQHGEEDGEQLRVVMRQLDPRDHARPFQFAVQVVGDNTYAGGWAGVGGWGCGHGQACE